MALNLGDNVQGARGHVLCEGKEKEKSGVLVINELISRSPHARNR